MSEPARKMKTEGTNGVRGGKKKAAPAELHLADRLAEARGRRAREGAAAAPATVEELAPESARDLAFLPWNVIDRSPLNPRRHFAPEPLEELAESILTAGGVKQNLLVRPRPDAPGRYWLIAGERRHRAVGLLVEAGRLPADVAVPVRVEADCDDARHLELALLENLQREGLNPMEEAEGYAALVARGLSAGEVARRILGRPEKTRYVQLRINLTDQLCPEAQEALREGKLSVEQARALKLAPLEAQAAHLPKIVERAWGYGTTDQIRRTVREALVPAAQFPKLRAAYEARGGRIVADEEAGEDLYADAALLRELQEEEIERTREKLLQKFAWVEVRGAGGRGFYHHFEYETDTGHELAGAVIEVHHDGRLQVHRHLVRKSDLAKLEAGARVDPEKGAVTAAPWTKGHLLRAAGRKSFALRQAVAADPRAAKRLVCQALLGDTTCVDLFHRGRDGSQNHGWNPLVFEGTIDAFRQRCGLKLPFTISESGQVYGREPDGEIAVWRGLCELPDEDLDRLFAVLVALHVGTFAGYDPRPGDPPVAVEIARSLGVAGHEAEHGLGLEAEDLEGLRKEGLLDASRRAGAKVTGAESLSAKALRETLAGLPDETRRACVLPTLQFRTREEMGGVR